MPWERSPAARSAAQFCVHSTRALPNFRHSGLVTTDELRPVPHIIRDRARGLRLLPRCGRANQEGLSKNYFADGGGGGAGGGSSCLGMMIRTGTGAGVLTTSIASPLW